MLKGRGARSQARRPGILIKQGDIVLGHADAELHTRMLPGVAVGCHPRAWRHLSLAGQRLARESKSDRMADSAEIGTGLGLVRSRQIDS